jgi:hypothetical protein
MEKRMDMGSLFTLTVISMRVNGEKIRLTVEVNILMLMVLSMMGTGNTISSMGLELSIGLMVPFMRETLITEVKRVKAFYTL